MKNLFSSRTILFAILLEVLGAIHTALPEMREQIPQEAYGWILMTIGVIVAALRVVTTTAISEK